MATPNRPASPDHATDDPSAASTAHRATDPADEEAAGLPPDFALTTAKLTRKWLLGILADRELFVALQGRGYSREVNEALVARTRRLVEEDEPMEDGRLVSSVLFEKVVHWMLVEGDILKSGAQREVLPGE